MTTLDIHTARPEDAEAMAMLLRELGPACREDFGPHGLANFLAPNTPQRTRERLPAHGACQ